MSIEPFIGSKISIISNLEIRYEGLLYTLNTDDATIVLQDVRCMGTEGRSPHAEVPPSSKVHDFIVFRGEDIKDLAVCSLTNESNECDPISSDPAIFGTYRRNEIDFIQYLPSKRDDGLNCVHGLNARKPSGTQPRLAGPRTVPLHTEDIHTVKNLRTSKTDSYDRKMKFYDHKNGKISNDIFERNLESFSFDVTPFGNCNELEATTENYPDLVGRENCDFYDHKKPSLRYGCRNKSNNIGVIPGTEVNETINFPIHDNFEKASLGSVTLPAKRSVLTGQSDSTPKNYGDTCYDRGASFFDNLTQEITTEKKYGKEDKLKQWKIDMDTFGEICPKQLYAKRGSNRSRRFKNNSNNNSNAQSSSKKEHFQKRNTVGRDAQPNQKSSVESLPANKSKISPVVSMQSGKSENRNVTNLEISTSVSDHIKLSRLHDNEQKTVEKEA